MTQFHELMDSCLPAGRREFVNSSDGKPIFKGGLPFGAAHDEPFGIVHGPKGVVKWRLAAWLAGGACVVLLAMLLHGRFARRRTEPLQRPDSGSVWTGPQTLPATAVSPANLATQPLGGVGLKVLRQKPDDIFAPAGALRLYALRRRTPGGAADVVAYTAEADIAEVESFYRTRLRQAGYELTQRRSGMQPGSVSLMFLRDMQQSYCVSLRPTDKENKVKIVLVVARPDR